MEGLLRRRCPYRLVELIRKHVKQTNDESLGLEQPLVTYPLGSEQ